MHNYVYCYITLLHAIAMFLSKSVEMEAYKRLFLIAYYCILNIYSRIHTLLLTYLLLNSCNLTENLIYI